MYVRLDFVEAVWERPDFSTEVQVGGESFVDMRTMEDLLWEIGVTEEMAVRLILRKTEADYNAVFTGNAFWRTVIVENDDLEKLINSEGWAVTGAEVFEQEASE